MWGVRSESIQQRLLSEAELTFMSAIKIATTMENARKNAQSLKTTSVPMDKVDQPSASHSTDSRLTSSAPCHAIIAVNTDTAEMGAASRKWSATNVVTGAIWLGCVEV